MAEVYGGWTPSKPCHGDRGPAAAFAGGGGSEPGFSGWLGRLCRSADQRVGVSPAWRCGRGATTAVYHADEVGAMTERGVITFVPGACAGRYRLLVRHGRRPRLEFWQALDTSSGREVALTLVDPEGELPEEFVHEILARTVRLKGIASPGIALVLDVFYTGSFGVVVSEWIHGGSLRQIADTVPSPVGVASAMQSLAAAAEAAHRAGLVLSIDDPGRLRVSTDGHVALAFPATLPEATTQSDLRYIGGALYALMVNRWPFTEK